MEFDDIQKIWDDQKSETLYAINETALHKNIKAKKNRSERSHLISTIGLNIISIVCGTILIMKDPDDIFNILTAIALFAIGIFVFFRNMNRKKQLRNYDHSLLGELDYAIQNTKHEIRYSQTFWLWYLVPIMLVQISEISIKSIKWESLLLLIGAYILSMIVIRLSLTRQLKPRLRKYEDLKKKLEV